MKNTLAENMLRFGVKNLKADDVKKIEESVLTEQTTFNTIESVWQDPRLKTDVTINTAEMQQGKTREQKYNAIIWQNLNTYLGTGNDLIGKTAIAWPKLQLNSVDLQLENAIPNSKWPIAEIFKGKNNVLNSAGEYTSGTEDCYYICSTKMTVKGQYGNQGTLYVDPDNVANVEQHKLVGIPNVPHFRLIGSNIYFFANRIGTPDGKTLVMSPLGSKQIVNSLQSTFM